MRLITTVCLTALIAGCAQMQTAAPGTPAAATMAREAPAAPKPVTSIPVRVADNEWYQAGQETLKENLARRPIDRPAKNVILFIADGMDTTTVTAARIFAGQQKGMSGEENVLAFETLSHVAMSKTYNTNQQVSDSAGTATAMLTGVKTKAGVISISDEAMVGDCAGGLANPVMTAGELAEQAGMAVGVVSTARLTHATPATVYSHSASRDWESDADLPEGAEACPDIASQLLSFPYGDGIDVALGGGRSNFMPKEMADPEYADRTGRRTDGRDLTAEWEANGGTFVWNKAGLEAASGKVLGLFEPSHMQYDADRSADDEPSLAEMTEKAIDLLSSDEDGYFLMVEGGRVDHAHHGGNASRALSDTVAFDEAVAAALEMVDLQDTLVIVTSDHGHTLTFAGYPKRGNPMLGVVVSTEDDGSPSTEPYPAGDGKPYTTLGYANGPGSILIGHDEDDHLERPDVSDEEAQGLDYQQQALIPSYSETHGGQDVTIYASGPQAYLFDGTVEQNYIFHVIDYALGLNQRAEAASAE
ncbi:alkaline phosphatase [Aquisalinus flavus]|uniref:Alkaline phosphatase n=1 Tax=Aquisalinus flavus TaxID=1526572 RepID=A0A8J2V526_9PROT|nr:alkaline phosphatase [Aquisalinus flavus]MBD0427745.1 alkaline phosphatase [Aquisalinus flavus]UNE47520.1 alkaline phosphatase [Aquisalinus flavus]GGD03479.1 alkaline phosphatase [Aquisalinus flavus]